MTRAPQGSRRAAQVLLAVFVTAAVGTFVWGLFVVNGVRAKAKRVDEALRSLAQACLSYHDVHGCWPDSEASLSPDAESLILVEIDYPRADRPFPVIGARGNPSGVDTLGEVNGWLAARHGGAGGDHPQAGSEKDP